MDVNSENTTPVANTSNNSMPSLDATDDIVESEAIPASDAIPPVTSSESTETEDNLNPEGSADIPAEPMNIAITNVETVAPDPLDTETENTPAADIEVPPVSSAEMPSEPQPETNEDNTEDPSEAIDQFIKKIADEQLSSKRVPTEAVEDNVANQLNEKSTDLTEAEEPLLPPQLRDELLTTQTNASTSKMEEDKQTKSELDVPVTKDDATTDTKKADKEGTEMDDRERLLAILKDPEPVEPKVSTPKETLPEVPEDKEPKTEPVDIAEDILAPLDVTKDPQMIKKAQEEIKAIDVLICGNCHEAFHFVEEFQEHKSKQCTKKSTLTAQCEAESKPQVWGFTLWKAKQSKVNKDGTPPPSSWAIYQKWCKLPQLDKDAWITAGQTLQFCSKIANAKITEFRPKIVTPPQVVEKDPLLIDNESNKENTKAVDKIKSTTELIKKGIVKPVKLNNDVTILPTVKASSDLNSNKAIRTTKVLSTQAQEYNVEKIVAKRFNPRRKIWEYQIKWENFPSDANTWEPVSNLNHCKQLLEQFEEQLRKIKEDKAKQLAAITPKGRGKPQKSTEDFASKSFTGSSSSGEFTPRRPTRSSKQKAISTVKAWCGTMSDEEAGKGGIKRPREDDDSDSSFDKKGKFEEEDSDSEIEEKPKAAKKVVKTPTATPAKKVIKNGATPPLSPTKQVLPPNILIPDANGVVRINQKQLPSLSTGVYIMSKTAGIIKLDSATSKVATSGGQTIVKVAPKIGQTQIKIVKKDGTITKKVIQMSPKDVVSPPPGKAKGVIPEIKSLASTKGKAINERPAAKTYSKANRGPKKISEPAKEPPAPVEEPEKEEQPEPEESDDGLEPMEFPDEIPEVRPESPPGEFVLDPITGKIAGQEYPDPPVEPPEVEKKPVKEEPETDSLDNIVKLAAADITEDDLKNDSLNMEVDQEEEPPRVSVQQNQHKAISMVTSTPKLTKITTTPRVTTKIVSARPSTTTTGQSILNKALTNTGVTLQPRVVGGMNMKSPRGPQPRVINQSIGQRGMTMQQTIRSITSTGPQQRMRQVAPKTAVKSKFNISPQPIITRVQPKVAMQSIGNNKVGVFSNKSPLKSPPPVKTTTPIIQQTRRVGNTIIRTVNNPTKPQPRIVQTVYKVSPKLSPRKEVLTTRVQKQMKPKPVISMPSLLGDEDDGLATLVRKEPQKVTTRIVQKSPTKTIVPEPTPPNSMAMAVPMEESVSKSEPAVEPTAMENAQEPAVSAPVNASAGENTGEAVTDLSSFTLADSENPIFITGDDGTVYQVAGQNEQGQTILITQGPDGQQQCLLVTNELGEASVEDNSAQENSTPVTTTAGETSTEQAAPVVSQQHTTTEMALSEEMEEQQQEHEEAEEEAAVSAAENVTEPLHIKTDGMEAEGDGSDQVVAQVVRAEPPSPGGTHKVVVMLPDGNLMVTAVSPEEYASLELE